MKMQQIDELILRQLNHVSKNSTFSENAKISEIIFLGFDMKIMYINNILTQNAYLI